MGLLLTAAPSVGDSTPPTTIVTWGEWGPYVAEELPGHGIASAIVTRAFQAIDREVTIELKPWNRAYKEGREGNHLAAFPYAHNEERAQDFLFTEALFTSTIRLFTARTHLRPATGFNELRQPSICLPQGYNTQVAESVFATTHTMIERPREMVNCLLMAKKGRVDFVLVSEQVGWFIIEHHPNLERNDFRLMKWQHDEPVHIMIPRALDEAESLSEQLNQALRQMKADGTMDAIFRDYQHYLHAQ